MKEKMWKVFVIIDYFGFLRKDWEYVVKARDYLKTLPVFRSLPNFMWYLITWYSLLMPQVLVVIFVLSKIYWSIINPVRSQLSPERVQARMEMQKTESKNKKKNN